MELRQLKYFISVVENGSVTKASERLHVAQPALGLQIRKLEAELGTALLVRHSRGVEVTDAGRIVLGHARSVLTSLEGMRHKVDGLTNEPRGTVWLGLTPSMAAILAPSIVERVTKSHPGISFTIVEDSSDHLVNLLVDREIQVALLYDGRLNGAIHITPLVEEPLYFIKRKERKAPESNTIAFANVIRCKLIVTTPSKDLRRIIEEAAAARQTNINIAHIMRSIPISLRLVEDGAGATVMPYGVARAASETGKFVVQRIVEPELNRTVYLAYLYGQSDNPSVRVVCDHVKAEIAKIADAADLERHWHPWELGTRLRSLPLRCPAE